MTNVKVSHVTFLPLIELVKKGRSNELGIILLKLNQ